MKIFISYRRTDAADAAGRIFDRMQAAFGESNVFKDVDSIPVGADFEDIIAERIADCDAVIVIIGQTWASVARSDGVRRLHDPADFVRIEIEQALSRRIPLVPTLVGNTAMPAPHELPESLQKLTRRNAISIRPDPDFHRDMDRLIQALQKPREPEARRSTPTLEAGAEVLPPSPPLADQIARAAQHRHLTLLACGCDLFESETILQTLDAEEQHDLLLDFQQLCRDVATQLRGTVVKATGHGLLICFGIPSALESAAHRAVRAGLTLLDHMASLNERLGRHHQDLHLSARLAVHSDRAVVTDNSSRGEALSIVGPVVPVVEQLERLAAPDTLVISDDTHRLLRGFVDCTSLGTQQLKGAAGARPIYRVHRELAAGRREDAAGPSGLIPLIGRDREVALLEERWEQAVDGQGQVVLLVGEAGIGKSRQVRVLKEHVAGRRTGGRAAMILEWPCSSLTRNSSLFHAIECFKELLDLGPHEHASGNLDKLAAHLEKLHLATAEAIALLGSLLSISLDGRYPPLGMSPQRQKEKTFDLLQDWLREQARRQPVLFVVEDLHWADPTTLEFLDLLIGQAQGAGLLTVLTFRPEFAPPWRARGHHTQVALNRLSRRQTGELMLLKSGLPMIPQGVLDQIADRTDGVPLFVEEFTAMVLEAGALSVVDGQVQSAVTFDAHAIPATLQDLLMARLDRMASNLDVVQLAATIGREFSYELLSAVASCGEGALQQELAKLVEAELLFQHGRLPAARFQFKHALIQDAAYQSLLKKKRQQLHLHIAEVLEQRFPETGASQPELLAQHFTEANAIPKAVQYWERAGERAQQRGALVESTGHFTRGLELILTLPETPERHAQEIQMHISLGVALHATKGYTAPEVEATYARAQTLCQQTGLTRQLFPVLYGLFRYWLMQAKYASASELAKRLLELAEREPPTSFVVAAHRALVATLFLRGKLADTLAHLEKALAVPATPELRSASYGYDAVDHWIAAESELTWVLWLLGYPERAAEHSRQALSTAEGLDHPFSVAFALCYASWLHHFRQEPEDTHATAGRMLALATEKGFTVIIGWARILFGWTLAERGQSEQALAEIRKGLVDLRAQGAVACRSYFLALLAEACARAGQPEESLQALAEAQEFANATGEAFWLPEIYRLKGELLLQHDPTAATDAEASFHLALEVARRQQARSLELRAAMSLAQLWCRQGKRQPAFELVEQVYAGFTEGFQTHDLQAARVLLEQWR